MSLSEGQSLLDFLDAPVLVVDPEGRVIFINPSFRRRFCTAGEAPEGEYLATLFAGGGRESMLAAVAEVCSKGESVRFRLREAGLGYLSVASAIRADDNRVGVMILLTDEPVMDSRLLDFHREIQDPLDETMACMDELVEQTGGRRDSRFRELLEQGVSALERARKWSEELHGVLCGSAHSDPGTSTLDPVRVVRQAASRLLPEFDRAEVELDLLIGNQLPAARGDGTLLETALVHLMRHRLANAKPGASVTLLARAVGVDEARGILVSIADCCAPGDQLSTEAIAESEPRLVTDTVSILAGRLRTVVLPTAGRISSIRLGLASD
jgi:PAS domain-containing protein